MNDYVIQFGGEAVNHRPLGIHQRYCVGSRTPVRCTGLLLSESLMECTGLELDWDRLSDDLDWFTPNSFDVTRRRPFRRIRAGCGEMGAAIGR